MRHELASFDKGLHALRETWRESRFNAWLRSNRRDARLVRDSGIRCTEALGTGLRTLCKKLPAHAAAVATGGLWTEAAWSGSREQCSACGEFAVPSVQHIL